MQASSFTPLPTLYEPIDSAAKILLDFVADPKSHKVLPKELSKEIKGYQADPAKYSQWAIAIYAYYSINPCEVSYIRVRIDHPIHQKGSKFIRAYSFELPADASVDKEAPYKHPWVAKEPDASRFTNKLGQLKKPIYGWPIAKPIVDAWLIKASDPDAELEDLYLIWCEGEKCVDAIYSHFPRKNVVALTTGSSTSVEMADTIGTLQHITQSQSIADACKVFNKVFVWPDADDAGRSAANDLLAQFFVGTESSQHPNNLHLIDPDQFDGKEDGYDVANWVDDEFAKPADAALTKEELLNRLLVLKAPQQTAKTHAHTAWEELSRLPRLSNLVLGDAPRLDLTLFHPLIAQVVESFSKDVQVPIEMTMGALKSQGHFFASKICNVRRDRFDIQPTSLNTLVLADSGSRKSTIDSIINSALYAWQSRQLFALKVKAAEIEEEKAAKEEKLKTALKEWKGFDANAYASKINAATIAVAKLEVELNQIDAKAAKAIDEKRALLIKTPRLQLMAPDSPSFLSLDAAAQEMQLQRLTDAMAGEYLETQSLDKVIRAYKSEFALTQLKLDAQKNEKALLEEKLANGATALKANYEALLKEETIVQSAHKVISDTLGSIEYLNQTLNTQCPFRLLLTDELASMFSAGNMDSKKVQTFCGIANQFHEGESPDRPLMDGMRKSEGRRARLTMNAMMQPEPFYQLFLDHEVIFTSTGFMPRLELVLPPCLIGYRPYQEPSAITPNIQKLMHIACELGANIPMKIKNGFGQDGGADVHTILKINHAAKQLWKHGVKNKNGFVSDGFNAVEIKSGSGRALHFIKAAAARFGALALRSAAALAVMRLLLTFAKEGRYTIIQKGTEYSPDEFTEGAYEWRPKLGDDAAKEDGLAKEDGVDMSSFMADIDPDYEEKRERWETAQERGYERKLDLDDFLSKLTITEDDMICALHMASNSLRTYALVVENAKMSSHGSLALNLLQSVVRLALKAGVPQINYSEFANRGFGPLRTQKQTTIKLIHDVLAGYMRMVKGPKKGTYVLELNPWFFEACQNILKDIQVKMPAFSEGEFNLFEAFDIGDTAFNKS